MLTASLDLPFNVLVTILPGHSLLLAVVLSVPITLFVGVVAGYLFGKVTGPPRGQKPPHGAPTQYRWYRVASGAGSGGLGGIVGFFLAGTFGQFAGYPVEGLGFGLGLAVASEATQWDWWRGTYIAGWIGSWVSGILIQSSTTLLPAGRQLLVQLGGTQYSFPLTLISSTAVGTFLAALTTKEGYTVAYVSRSDTQAAASFSGVVWLSIMAGASFLLGTVSGFWSLASAVLTGGPGPPLAFILGPASLVGLAIGISILIPIVTIPYVSTRLIGLGENRDVDVRVPSRISTFWKVVPGLGLGFMLGLTVLAAFVLGTGTKVPTGLDVAAILGSCTVFGALVNSTAISLTREAADEPHKEYQEDDNRTAYFQTVGALFYGVLAALSLTGIGFYMAEFLAKQISSQWFLPGLVFGIVLGLLIVGLFRSYDRRAQRLQRGAAQSPGPTPARTRER